ncbi:hypothetical protein [Niabella ginsenosidivorans]|uniref:hypothetical protein n=1 Tax=Niabella ginsenosidivorans TaxID=1176587 RepID=UPI0008FC1E74|nr:hypothetical protein [Niabella ginsenosidivorans]
MSCIVLLRVQIIINFNLPIFIKFISIRNTLNNNMHVFVTANRSLKFVCLHFVWMLVLLTTAQTNAQETVKITTRTTDLTHTLSETEKRASMISCMQ